MINNEVMETIIRRRSTRKYRPEQIGQEELETIIEAGRYAPSGGNLQNNHLIVIQNPQILSELDKLAAAEFAGMEYREDLYSSVKNSIRKSLAGGYHFFYESPTLVIVASPKDYPNNIANASCVLENMMIAAESIGVGACWINQLHWLDENENVRAFEEKLGLKKEETVVGALSLGYRADEAQPLPRKGNPVDYIR